MTIPIGLDKIKGCLYGSAIGDAMGGPLEPFDAAHIQEHFGGRIETLVDYAHEGPVWYWKGYPKGTYTDDTIMRNVVCKCIIKNRGRINAPQFAYSFVHELTVDNFTSSEGQLWPGNASIWFKLFLTLGQPYNELIHMPVPRELGHGSLPACDAAMMIQPIGLVNAGNAFQAEMDAIDVSSVLQSGTSATAPSAIAAAVAIAMIPGSTLDEIIDAAIDNTDETTADLITRAVALARASSSPSEFKAKFHATMLTKIADALEVVPAAFGVLAVVGGDPRQTVIEASNFGRDCDSIATIAGGIAGTLHGFDAWPKEWVESVHSANPGNPSQDELAEGIFSVLAEERNKSQARVELLDRLLA